MATSSSMEEQHFDGQRHLFAGDLRRMVPVWKPIPTSEIQRCGLPDNGSMGFAITTPNQSDTKDVLSSSGHVISVKQNNATRFSASSGGCPTPLVPPSAVFTIEELEHILQTSSFDKNTLRKKMRLLTGIEKNKEFLMKLNKLKSKLTGTKGHTEGLKISRIILDMVNLIPDDFTNTGMMLDELLCNGGGVCYADMMTNDTNNAILYSSGKKLNHLVYLPITVDSKLPQMLQPDWSSRKSVKFPRKIHQVSTMKIRDRVFCGVRMDRKLNIGGINVNNVAFKKLWDLHEEQSYITDLGLSPFIPEFLYVTDTGCVNIANLETGTIVDQYQKPSKRSQWWACRFAWHPRCFVFTRRNAVMLRDRRDTARRSSTLLKSPSMGVLRGETFCSYANTTTTDVLPHLHYVGSSHSLFLIDDRYPRHPVLTWKHQLTSRPGLLSAALWDSSDSSLTGSSVDLDDAVFLASRASQENVVFHLRHSCDKINGQLSMSVSPPLHLHSPKDLATVLMDKGRATDFRSRLFLHLPLHGICCIPHAADRRLAVVYQTVDGNVYSQAFRHVEDEPDEGILAQQRSSASLLSDERQLDHVCHWLQDLTASMPSLSLNSNEVEDGCRELNTIKLFMELMKDGPHSHSCLPCSKCDAPTTADNDEICPKCNVPVQLIRKTQTSTLTTEMFKSSTNEENANGIEPLVPDYTLREQPRAKVKLTSCYDMVQNVLDAWRYQDTDSQDMSVASSALTSRVNQSFSQLSDLASNEGANDSNLDNRDSLMERNSSLRSPIQSRYTATQTSPATGLQYTTLMPVVDDIHGKSANDEIISWLDQTATQGGDDQDGFMDWSQRSFAVSSDNNFRPPYSTDQSQDVASLHAGIRRSTKVTPLRQSKASTSRWKSRTIMDGF